MSDQTQPPTDATTEQEGAAPTAETTPPTDAAPTEAQSAPTKELSIEERLAAVEKERDEYLDQWRRSAAEFQNFKKREERLRVERERNASNRLLLRLIPVLDDLRRAGQHVPADFSQNDWVGGVLAIERKLWSALEQEGVSVIEAEPGTVFDPAVHEALMSQEHESIEAEHIIQELERGYRRQETILRPARVSVAK